MASSPDAWVHPEDLFLWELRVYALTYHTGYESYKLHFWAAHKGNKKSIERMDFTADQIAIARLKSLDQALIASAPRMKDRAADHAMAAKYWPEHWR